MTNPTFLKLNYFIVNKFNYVDYICFNQVLNHRIGSLETQSSTPSKRHDLQPDNRQGRLLSLYCFLISDRYHCSIFKYCIHSNNNDMVESMMAYYNSVHVDF